MTDSASHTLNHPFTADLLKWYTEAAADLPWRRSRDPYRVWLSEIMLQQTQVATVIPYFERFIAAYPDVRALAAAPLAAVLKCWEGLGYYSRARNLHRAAQEVVNACDGKFPTSAAALIKLPGIGRYTANAIASIAFGERVAALDGNVIRVLSRLYDIPDEVSQPKTQERLWMLAEALITDESVQEPGEYNQAMMELGREICRPRKPRCGVCPVREHCAALAAGTQSERPNKRRKATLPHYEVAAGVIYDDSGRVLIAQRPLEGLLGGLWEFPAARCSGDDGESLVNCLKTALRQTLAVDAEIGTELIVVKHSFTHFKIRVHAFEGRLIPSMPKFIESNALPVAEGYADYRWALLAELDQYVFARTDRKVIDFLRGRDLRLF